MKRTLYILITLILLVILFGGGYWYFFMRANDAPETPSDDSIFIFGDNGRLIGDINNDTPTDHTPDVLDERFLEITNDPVAGFTVFERSNGTSTTPVIRYVLRSTGHIYDYNITTGQRSRISNTTIPHVFNAVWTSDGSGVFAQKLINNFETIETTLITIDETSATSTQARFVDLPQNISSIETRGERFAWVRTERNEAVIEVGSIGGTPEEIYRSGITEWAVSWKNNTTLLLTTKPSGTTPGYSYELNISNGSLRPFLRSITGLTVLPSPNGEETLYSRSTNNTFNLFSTAEPADPTQIPPQIQTFPEKCVFSPRTEVTQVYCALPQSFSNGTYPDEWYQGKTSFNDRIYYINLEYHDREELYNPQRENGLTLDMINPRITPDEHYFIFQDKQSGRIFRLRI